MQRHLFVYGTLMTAAGGARLGRSVRARLHRAGVSLGAATLAGELYDLGRYPGLVTVPTSADLVHGEMFRLADPPAVFAWLDAYENATPGDPAGEYERALRTATVASGVEIEAWVYLYRGDLARARLLPDGRWLPQVDTGRRRS